MDFVGHIESVDDQRPLLRDVWRSLTAAIDDLSGIDPKAGRNPFTGDSVLFNAPDDSVRLMRDGTELGGFSWAMDDSPIVNVDAAPNHIESVVVRATELADCINCQFVRADVGSSIRLENSLAIHRSVQHGFYARPSAHLGSLATGRMALVQSLVVQASFASFRAVS